MFVEKLTKSLIKTLTLVFSRGFYIALLAFSLAVGAHAANLDQAKSQGMACELPTGYLQATGNASGEVKAMVQDINAKRQAEYQRIAKQNNVQPDQVAKLTAQKLSPKCP